MKWYALLFITSLQRQYEPAASFVTIPSSQHSSFPSASKLLKGLPTVNEVANDDFMKQLGHTSRLIPLLHEESSQVSKSDLSELLNKQLSHSEGIRGFFAVYLTSPESLEKDDDVPSVLVEAVRGANAEIMAPLACMNVVMPTAMSILHQDAELKECAAKTAENGKKILRLLKGHDLVIDNCMAIDRVCADVTGEDELFRYWEKFFQNYKYGPKEKEAIGLAVAEFC